MSSEMVVVAHIFAARAMATRMSTPREVSSLSQSGKANCTSGGIASTSDSFGGIVASFAGYLRATVASIPRYKSLSTRASRQSWRVNWVSMSILVRWS